MVRDYLKGDERPSHFTKNVVLLNSVNKEVVSLDHLQKKKKKEKKQILNQPFSLPKRQMVFVLPLCFYCIVYIN